MEFVFHDFEQYREAALGWGLEFTQLDRGTFHATLRQVAAPKVSLTHFNLNRKFLQRGGIQGNGRTFAIFLNRVSDMRWRNSPEVGSNTLVVFPPDGSLDALTHPGFDAVSISVDLPFLRETARQQDLERAYDAIPRTSETIQTDHRIINALRVAILTLFQAGECAFDRKAIGDIESQIAYLILLGIGCRIPQRRSRPNRKRDRAFSMAVEMIIDAPEPPSIRDICKRVGASERTLRYAFQEHMDVSPKQFLNAHRLNRVRRSLLSGPDGPSPIQDTAAEFGFWHTGQFAADYRSMFGELPSETLLR